MPNASSNPAHDSTNITRSLVNSLRKGEKDAARLFDLTYRDALVRFCWGYLKSVEEAEDAIQDITFKVLTADPIPDRFRPWLYKVARNHCLNLLRNRGRRPDHGVMPADSAMRASITGNLSRLVKDEMKEQVSDLVETLPSAQREVLRLRYAEDLSRAEIAEILDTPESVVKSRIFEGLRTLRKYTRELRED